MKNKKNRTMMDVTKGYEAFIKRKELNSNGTELFNKVLRKAATPKPKQRGSK